MSTVAASLSDWPNPIVNHLEVSNPDEDSAREHARLAESEGLPPHATAQVVAPGKRDVEPAGAVPYSSPPTSAQKRQDFSHERPTKKETRLGNYYLGRTLGEGEFGKVKLGWKHGANAQVAVKIIRKDKLQDNARMQKVFREVNILKGLEHPNIVRLHEMVETERTIGIVLEYAPCGELFNFILNQRYLKDNHAKKLFAQLVSAVGYLHKKGIIHRDLKLENLLLDRNQNIIVTDFGFANKFDPTDELGEQIEARLHDRNFVDNNRLGALNKEGYRRGDLMATSCGSPCYAAPELVISDGLYTGRKVDVWSIGVILYAMLAGYLPYDDDPRNPDGDNINLLYSYISETELKFPDYVSPHARDLLKRILRPDPRKRADLFEVARHSWLSGFEDVVDAITSSIMDATGMSPAIDGHGRGQLTRSASAREATNPVPPSSPVGGLISKHGNVGQVAVGRTKPRDPKRQTLQVEYVAPQPHQRAPEGSHRAYETSVMQNSYEPEYYASTQPLGEYYEGSTNTRKRMWDEQQTQKGKGPMLDDPSSRPIPPPKTSMPPPTRPARDVARAVSDSTAFTVGQITSVRPNTQASIAGPRLPSRGSYGQPVGPQVATTNAQGRFSQPRPPTSMPLGDSEDVSTSDFANGKITEAEKPQESSAIDGAKPKRGHTRSHTLSDLTQKVFGRSVSVKRTPESRPRPDRSYPPTSMKPVDSPATSRKSTESRRSFAFVRKSTEFGNTNPKRSSRRFSFIPRFGASSKDLTPPQTAEVNSVQTQSAHSNADGSDQQSQSTTYPSKTYPPNSYQQSLPYNNTSGPYNYRAASAGNPTSSQQSWPLAFQPLPLDQDSSSRLGSPAVAFDSRKEKAAWDSENWGQNRKFHTGKTGPAQRVMDFFRGRRQDRSNMA